MAFRFPRCKAQGGVVSDSLFADQLRAIFLPETKTTFQFRQVTARHALPADEFPFHFDSPGSPEWNIARSYPGMSGSIWVEEQSGDLQRVETKATSIIPELPLESFKSEMNYREVPIPDLGNLLLPINGKVEVCLRPGVCFRNELSFHDCQKFEGVVRIVPNP